MATGVSSGYPSSTSPIAKMCGTLLCSVPPTPAPCTASVPHHLLMHRFNAPTHPLASFLRNASQRLAPVILYCPPALMPALLIIAHALQSHRCSCR